MSRSCVAFSDVAAAARTAALAGSGSVREARRTVGQTDDEDLRIRGVLIADGCRCQHLDSFQWRAAAGSGQRLRGRSPPRLRRIGRDEAAGGETVSREMR